MPMEKIAIGAMVVTAVTNILCWAGLGMHWVSWCVGSVCVGSNLFVSTGGLTIDQFEAAKAFAILTMIALLVALGAGIAFMAEVKQPTTIMAATAGCFVAAVFDIVAIALFADLYSSGLAGGFYMYVVVIVLALVSGGLWIATKKKTQ